MEIGHNLRQWNVRDQEHSTRVLRYMAIQPRSGDPTGPRLLERDD